MTIQVNPITTPLPQEGGDSSKAPLGFMRVPQITEYFGISRSLWFVWVASGKAPQPIKLSCNLSVWKRTDIYALYEKLAAEHAADSKGASNV